MTKILDRKGDTAVIGGEIKIKLPPTMTALSLFSGKIPYYHGDDLTREEHYIVNDVLGTRRKKMTEVGISYGGIMVWTKVKAVPNLAHLEARFQEMKARIEPERKKLFGEIITALQRVKKAHVIPVRHLAMPGNKNYSKQVREYHYHEHSGPSFSFDWIDKPEKMLHPDVGAMIYSHERRLGDLNQRLLKFRVVFEDACCGYIWMHADMTRSGAHLILLNINGREYSFENTRRGLYRIESQRLPYVKV